MTLGFFTISGKCGEPISSSPSQTSTRFTGSFTFRGFERAQRAEERSLGTFLVHRTASHADLAQTFLVDDLAFERRRRPLRRIELLHVVHEVNADRRGRAGVDDSEDAGLAGGGHDLDVGESSLASQLRHVLRTLRIVAVLGRDRRQRDPFLQVLDVFVMHLRNLAQYRLHVGIVGGESRDWQCGEGGSCQCALDELSTIERALAESVTESPLESRPIGRWHWVP